ncbi:MAG: hypothetical protein RL341_578 [Pseudomonadota bacterium]|jgi:hypothetical protein
MPLQHDEVFQNRDERIAQMMFALLSKRQPQASICPSDVARALAPTDAAWRALVPHVRTVAAQLVRAGTLEVTQRGEPVDPAAARGPIRLRLPPAGKPT